MPAELQIETERMIAKRSASGNSIVGHEFPGKAGRCEASSGTPSAGSRIVGERSGFRELGRGPGRHSGGNSNRVLARRGYPTLKLRV